MSRASPLLRVSLVLRKESIPFFSSSMVNLMVGRTSLRWWSKCSTSPLCIMQPVLSTCCFQNLGLKGTDSKASVVRCMLGKAEAPRDYNQRAQGCMHVHEGGYLEVCHRRGISNTKQTGMGRDRTTRPIQLKVEEALHIERTPLTPDSIATGDELPGCWITTMKKQTRVGARLG